MVSVAYARALIVILNNYKIWYLDELADNLGKLYV